MTHPTTEAGEDRMPLPGRSWDFSYQDFQGTDSERKK
eukprot:CAMPEP_0177401086 /NCGR_PEP_ID=MMETSP0368-20130122/59457_1 /TAXON_ID=447022 ORGANISM="Scrippsiella hangoei-like, Strain SHHI-4" /NCGR_SAMPLE_ID=MMETSP0368 /ASSEMBLY_ACC=CAM_ASM_000363 /LENGTH=36 /DNA_ID= /DNA_START= /DNA_END= /DNA_ORIENTATION=